MGLDLVLREIGTAACDLVIMLSFFNSLLCLWLWPWSWSQDPHHRATLSGFCSQWDLCNYVVIS